MRSLTAGSVSFTIKKLVDEYFNQELNRTQFAKEHGIPKRIFNGWLKDAQEPQPGTSIEDRQNAEIDLLNIDAIPHNNSSEKVF